MAKFSLPIAGQSASTPTNSESAHKTRAQGGDVQSEIAHTVESNSTTHEVKPVKYQVDDTVLVTWDNGVYEAKVVSAHCNDKVMVTYAADNTWEIVSPERIFSVTDEDGPTGSNGVQ